MTAKRKKREVTHAFRYQILDATGNTKERIERVKVKPAKKGVKLTLLEEHVQRAIDNGGVGNTGTCSMAVCAQKHSHSFPHPVEGTIDWSYSRCWVISKVDKWGKPIECICYEHSDEIAKLNDSLGGQKKLLAMLKKDGPLTINLKPMRQRSEEGRSGRDRKSTGVRAYRPTGAKLRHAVAVASSTNFKPTNALVEK